MKRISNLSKILGMLAFVALMVCTLAFGVSAASYSDVDSSVVLVVDDNKVHHATGIVIGSQDGYTYVVTSSSILGNNNNSTPYVYLFNDAGTSSRTNVRYVDAAKEIAILEFERAPEGLGECVFANANDVTPDTGLRAICYSNQIAPNNLGSSDLTLKRLNVAVLATDIRKNNSVFKVDVSNASQATKGAPVVNEDGKVIGLLIDENDKHVLYSEEIIEILDEEGFPYSTGGIGFITWIIIGAAALIVIIILVVIIVISKNKKKSDDYENAPMIETKGIDSAAGSQVISSGSVPAAPAQPAPAMRVISCGGALNGKTYSVTGSAKIGRDASRCAITYPVNTQGVSGCHCELTFDGTVCYLKDMKSSFGTFLSDGTRLAPFAPQLLRSGDTFYLAGPENTFEVRF